MAVFLQDDSGGIGWGPKPKPKPKPVVHAHPQPHARSRSISNASPNQDNLSINPAVRNVQVQRSAARQASPNDDNLSINPAVRNAQIRRAAAKTAINNTQKKTSGSSGGGGVKPGDPGWHDPGFMPSGGGGYSGGGSTPGVGSGGAGGAGGGAGTNTGPAAPATTRKVVIPDITLDPDYQRAITQYNDQLSTYNQQIADAKAAYDRSYNSTLANIGWNPLAKQWAANDNSTQYGTAYRGNMEDFSGRGAYGGTDYFGALGDMNAAFTRQTGQMASARQDYQHAEDASGTAYGKQIAQNKINALTEAAARTAANLGIDVSKVPTSGGKKTITVPVTG